MTVPETLRRIVVARSGGTCEYCRLVESACGVTFHIEHFHPESSGGMTTLDNLVLSCPGCNLSKGARTTAEDRAGNDQPLFNPRNYEPSHLGWHLHFILGVETGIISSRSEIGEAMIDALAVNSPNRVFARKLQIQIGLIR